MITKYLIVFLIRAAWCDSVRGSFPYSDASGLSDRRHRKYASGSGYFPVRSKGSCLGM